MIIAHKITEQNSVLIGVTLIFTASIAVYIRDVITVGSNGLFLPLFVINPAHTTLLGEITAQVLAPGQLLRIRVIYLIPARVFKERERYA